jgi:hypothetical protein
VELGLRATLGEQEVARRDADFLRVALLATHVELGGGILADEDDGERGRRARALPVGGGPRP